MNIPSKITPEWQLPVNNLQKRFTENISILHAMGVQIDACDGESVRLAAPLAQNYNDKGTGFAGSIASLAALSGWALLTLKLTELVGANDVAIFDAQIKYLQPITGDFTATSKVAESSSFQEFTAKLQERGKAKITLVADVMQGNDVKATIVGKYVAFLKSTDE